MSKATTHKDSQLWGHRKWLCPRNGVWNDQIGFGGMQRTCTPKGSRAHLLGQEHGPLRQLVWVWAGLLPHWDLLGQKVFTLKGKRKWFGNQKKHIYAKSRDTVVAAVSPEKKHSAKHPPPFKKKTQNKKNNNKKTSQVLKDISLQSFLDHCPQCSFDNVLRGWGRLTYNQAAHCNISQPVDTAVLF